MSPRITKGYDTHASVVQQLGARTFSKEARQQEDYYATEPNAVRLLLKLEKFQHNVLEPFCGEGHIAKVLEKAGHNVKGYDIIDRGYGQVKNFLFRKSLNKSYDIVSNPPYKDGTMYVEKCLSLLTSKKQKVALLLRLLFLEGKARRNFFREYPPIRVWISSGRITCAKNGDFTNASTGAVSFAWFVWQGKYKGPTTLGWFN